MSSLTVVTRPNGKLYRARKPAAAIILNEDSEYLPIEVLVIRTTDIDEARDLANREYATVIGKGDPGLDHWPYEMDWWREQPNGSLDDMRWVPGYPQHGAPGFLFTPLQLKKRTS